MQQVYIYAEKLSIWNLEYFTLRCETISLRHFKYSNNDVVSTF